MLLRDFEAADQPRCAALVQAGLAERWGDDFDPDRNTDLDDIAGSYTTGGACFVVACAGERIVGTGALVPDGPGTARIVRMSVDRRHRRQGVARSIVVELLERARHADASQVLVTTDTPWASAVALYASCGFVQTGRDPVATHFELQL